MAAWWKLGRRVCGLVILASALVGGPTEAAAPRSVKGYADAALADGFYRTVFGVEHGSRRYGHIVKKFQRPVRFAIVNRAAKDRGPAVRGFIGSLPKLVRGLSTSIVADPAKADFTVIVVDRASYVETVRADVLGSHIGRVPGSCLVKVDMGRDDIARATAVVVSDEGDPLFRRCMTEEILQGLGPMNDDASLADSVFNDRSRHARFTAFDRAILSMLYHPDIRHGMSRAEVADVLPGVIADVRHRLR